LVASGRFGTGLVMPENRIITYPPGSAGWLPRPRL
jgi:hypothetical protein